ncbi:hypothetical protein BS78_04G121400 [Paspalum vaginatum]|nr:hypothetical protein BS78_04G121400 [Paspalum vaginatum]
MPMLQVYLNGAAPPCRSRSWHMDRTSAGQAAGSSSNPVIVDPLVERDLGETHVDAPSGLSSAKRASTQVISPGREQGPPAKKFNFDDGDVAGGLLPLLSPQVSAATNAVVSALVVSDTNGSSFDDLGNLEVHFISAPAPGGDAQSIPFPREEASFAAIRRDETLLQTPPDLGDIANPNFDSKDMIASYLNGSLKLSGIITSHARLF